MRAEWEKRALDFDAYLQKADMNVPTMIQNYHDTKIPEDHARYFEYLDRCLAPKSVTVLAISESWCGDCVENLPVVARLAGTYNFLRLVIFPRDTNLDIMDEYLTEGKRTIPVFVLFDQEGKEIGRFIERPPGAHEFMRKGRERIERLPEAQRQRALYELRSELRKAYRDGLRDETIGSIRGILEKRYGREDA